MARYVLNLARVPSEEEVAFVTKSDTVQLLDSGRRMMLVEGAADEVQRVADSIRDAVVVPEETFSAGSEQRKLRLKLKR